MPSPAMDALGIGNLPGLGERYSAAVKQSEDATQKVQQSLTDKNAALAPVEEKMKAQAAAAPAAPKLENIGGMKFQHQGLDPQQMTDAVQTMFAFAAIGGAMTRTPMTAALSAFSKGIEGLVKGDQIVFQREKDEFDRHLKSAIAKNTQAIEEYKMAAEKHKGDLGATMNEWRLIAAKHQDTVALAQFESQNAKGAMQHIENLVKMNEQAKRTDSMIQQGWARIESQNKRTESMERARSGHDELMRDLAKHKQEGGRLTESEAKSTTNWNEMQFANTKLDELTTKGVSAVPITAQYLGRLYDPEKGGWFTSAQQELRNNLTSPEEKQAFDSSLAYTLAQAHAQGGARPSAYQVQMIWNTYIPMAGEDEGTQRFKRELRMNALESVKVSAGKGAERLEAGRGKPAGGAGGAAAPVNAKGWKLHQDASGNKAYVGPNNEIEEVK